MSRYYQRPINKDMHHCIRLEEGELALGERTGGMHCSWQIPDGADRTIVIIGERAQEIRDCERSLNGQEDSDGRQGHMLSDSE